MAVSFYYLNVTVHVLAALLWLGGMFFLGLVGAPVLRQIEPPALRVKLFRLLGQRFRTIGWSAIAGLVALVWSLGAGTVIFDAIYLTGPGVNWFRGQERAAYLVGGSVEIDGKTITFVETRPVLAAPGGAYAARLPCTAAERRVSRVKGNSTAADWPWPAAASNATWVFSAR